MRLTLLPLLSLCLLVAACADHSATSNLIDGTTDTDTTAGNPDVVTRIVDEPKVPDEDQPPQINPPGGQGNSLDPDDGTDGGGGGQPVPEPGTLLLVGTGLAGVAFLRRRRKTPTAS